jgi:hypothetical protein
MGVLTALLVFFNVKSDSNEGFLGSLPSMKWKVDREIGNNKGDLYSIPGQYQSILNPRFSNVDYGANIRYNMPSYENQAVPCNPLTMGNMAQKNYKHKPAPPKDTKEGYCGQCGGGCGSVSCGKGGAAPLCNKAPTPVSPAGFAGGNYNEVLSNAYQQSEFPTVDSLVPVGDMTTVNSLGETVQPIVYDRYIYANRNSRLRSQGDPIRGDLPIVPCGADWFRPSVHPNIDLQEGAMNVIGGISDSSMALASLINTASGNANTTIGGVDLSNQFSGTVSAGMRDVNISAFP